MPLESLNALVITQDDAVFQALSEGLRRVGAASVLHARSSQAAVAEMRRQKFSVSVGVVHVDEDLGYDKVPLHALLQGADAALRFPASFAVVRARSREFLAEVRSLGFSAVMPLPLNQTLVRLSLNKLVANLEAEYRNPDLETLRRALDKGDLDFVEDRCLKALRRSKQGHPLLGAWLGEVYFRRGRFADALGCIQKVALGASVADPMASDAIRLLAKTLHKMGRSEEAFSELLRLPGGEAQSRSVVTGLVPLLHAYASQRKAHGHSEEAVACYEMALREPDARQYEGQLNLNLGLAHAALGQWDAARQAALRSVASSPQGRARKAQDLLRYIESRIPVAAAVPDDVWVAGVNDTDLGSAAVSAQRDNAAEVGSHETRTFEFLGLGGLDGAGDVQEPPEESQQPIVPEHEPGDGEHDFSVQDQAEVSPPLLDAQDEPSEAHALQSVLESETQGLDMPVHDEGGDGQGPGLETFFGAAAESGPELPNEQAVAESADPPSALGSALDEMLDAVASPTSTDDDPNPHKGTALPLPQEQVQNVGSENAARDLATEGEQATTKAESEDDPRTRKWGLMPDDKILAYIMFEGEFPAIKVKPLKIQPTVKAEWVREAFELEDTGSDG